MNEFSQTSLKGQGLLLLGQSIARVCSIGELVLYTNIEVFNYFLLQKMDEENQINDKLKIMKFSLLPCGLKHAPFFIVVTLELVFSGISLTSPLRT